jgi:hypothetical protein
MATGISDRDHALRVYQAVVLLLALIPLSTGPLDLVLGLEGPRSIGMALSDIDLRDPILNSQVRFFGAVWLGTGLLMGLGAVRFERYGGVLKVIFAVLAVAGLGRLVSVVQFGLPAAPVGVAFVFATIILEVGIAPLMLLWQHRLERSWTARVRA